MLEQNNPMRLTMDTYAISNEVEVINNGATVTFVVEDAKYLSYGKKLTQEAKYEIIRDTSFEPEKSPINFYFKDIHKKREHIAIKMLSSKKDSEKYWEKWVRLPDGTILNNEMCAELSKIDSNVNKLNEAIKQEEVSYKELVKQYTKQFQEAEEKRSILAIREEAYRLSFSFIDEDEIPF